MLTMLGIPNCDTIKKARKFLDSHQVEYRFRDVRSEPLTGAEWLNLVEQDSDQQLINTRSPSFRKTGHVAADLDNTKRVAILLEQPSAMKRPTMVRNQKLITIGFKINIFLDSLGGAE